MQNKFSACLIIAFLCLFSQAQAAENQTEPPQVQIQTEEQDVWNFLFQNRLQALEKLMSTVDSKMKELTAMLNTLKKDTTAIAADGQKLYALSQISRHLPMELGVVLEQLQALKERLNIAANPAQSFLELTNNNLEEIKQLKLNLDGTSVISTATPEASSYLKRITAAEKSLTLLKTRLSNAMSPVDTLRDNISNQQAGIVSALPDLWQAYYLSPSNRLFDHSKWTEIFGTLDTFKETFILRMSVQFPQSLQDLMYVGFRLAVFMLFAWTGILLVRRLANTANPVLKSGLARLSRHSLPWLSVGLGFYVAAWAPSGDPYHVLIVFATFLLSLGQMALAWDVRSFHQTDLPLVSPLYALFKPLLGGLLLLFFNLPPVPLGTLWICILVFCIWSERRTGIPNLIFQLEGNILRTHTVFLWVLLILTMFGFGRLSILLCMAFAALAVCLQQAVGFIQLSNAISTTLPQDGFKGLLGGVILALAVPFILVLATMLTGLWTLAYPGGAYLLDQVARLDIRLGEQSLNLAQMLLILSAFYITRTAISVGSIFIRKLSSQSVGGFNSSLMSPLQTAYAYVLWLVFGLYTLKAVGFSLTSLTVVAGGLSVGVGFGMQSIINNFVSGLLMIFGQNLREGDVIEVGVVTGVVKKINIRSTVVETYDNATIFVPNGTLISNNLTNWTRNGRMVRKELKIGVAYGTDPVKVIELLKNIANSHPQVLAFPEPLVFFQDFGQSTLDFLIRVWLSEINQGSTVLSDLRININETFKQNNIEIAFPQLDVHIKNGVERNVQTEI